MLVLQQALFPTSLPKSRTPRSRRGISPRTDAGVGGDWYAVLPLSEGRLGLAIGDVAGHGLDAVADMAAARFSLRALALNDPAPECVLDRLNQVVHVFESDTMVTAFFGALDPPPEPGRTRPQDIPRPSSGGPTEPRAGSTSAATRRSA